MMAIEQKTGELLLDKGFTISAAESCTGGLFTGRLTEVAGSSAYVKGSIVSYTNEIKTELVGVRSETLAEYGAVSEHTAKEMAEGVRDVIGTDIGVGITGNAGPGASEGKPVGLVYIAVSGAAGVVVSENHFEGDRASVREKTVNKALEMLCEYIDLEESF